MSTEAHPISRIAMKPLRFEEDLIGTGHFVSLGLDRGQLLRQRTEGPAAEFLLLQILMIVAGEVSLDNGLDLRAHGENGAVPVLKRRGTRRGIGVDGRK